MYAPVARIPESYDKFLTPPAGQKNKKAGTCQVGLERPLLRLFINGTVFV